MAFLPSTQTRAIEMLQIIATKGVRILSLNSMVEKDVGPYKTLSAGTLGKVMSKLAKLKRDQWPEKASTDTSSSSARDPEG